MQGREFHSISKPLVAEYLGTSKSSHLLPCIWTSQGGLSSAHCTDSLPGSHLEVVHKGNWHLMPSHHPSVWCLSRGCTPQKVVSQAPRDLGLMWCFPKGTTWEIPLQYKHTKICLTSKVYCKLCVVKQQLFPLSWPFNTLRLYKTSLALPQRLQGNNTMLISPTNSWKTLRA